uniref:Uncharacterized protein n=1 Tax=Avena sativa TaxID=4498 RepID=A0ACD5U2R0_AVESA
MREWRANGGVGREGGGADAAPTEAVRRQKLPQSNASSSGSAASSSSGGAEAEERGGKDRLGRRRSRRREDVVRAIRDRLPAAPSCWGNSVSVVQERRGPRERPGAGDAVEVEEEEGAGFGSGSGAGTAAALPAWCCICPEGDCRLEANPSANGKEDPGLRSLLERNDFYSDDCNPHAAATTAAGNANDDDVASEAADFD